MLDVTAAPGAAGPNGSPQRRTPPHATRERESFHRIQMEHQFAVDEVLTKVSIVRREHLHLNGYDPIEHVSSRVKSPSSILEKATRCRLDLTPEAIRAGITDIAGVRITCGSIADTYRMLDILTSQADVQVLQVTDYIAGPRPSGYRSLHAVIEIPVFLATGPLPVTVEVQVRTVAMDIWAGLEHKVYDEYDGEVPDYVVAKLLEVAEVADQLDRRVEQLHIDLRGNERHPGGRDATSRHPRGSVGP